MFVEFARGVDSKYLFYTHLVPHINKTGEPVSLLSARKSNPVVVTGRLQEVEDEQVDLVRDPGYKKLTVGIPNVTMYAFAEFEGGGHGFWAAGQAGWFEIEGALPSYRPIYDEMGIAASMLYFLADRVRHSRKANFAKSQFNAHIKRLFRDYLAIGRDPTRFTDTEDVREGFHDHREFLITSMLEGQERLNWTDTPMLTYFKLHFPDDVLRIKSKVLGADVTLPPVTFSCGDAAKGKSHPVQVEESIAKRKKGRPGKDSKPRRPETSASKESVGDLTTDEDNYVDRHVITRKRKSILRPSGSRYSKKARKAIGRRKSVPDPGDTDNVENERIETMPPAEESPITTIKNDRHLDLLTNPPTNQPSPTSPPSPRYLPRKYLEVKSVRYDVPNMEPQGPGDMWTCTFEGCYHKIQRASTRNGKTKIEDHFVTHKSQAQEKIDLAYNESRPYLPVK
ncbi:MAG: hypothetical protein Q9163_003554 [Psora crenata]